MINIKRAFNYLDVLGVKRSSGTKLEKKAADYIYNELKLATDNVEIEEFKVPRSLHNEGLIEIPNTDIKIKVNPMGFGTDTGSSGVVKAFIHIDSVTDVSVVDVFDKVVLVNSLSMKEYKKLVLAGAYGVIRITGSLYDKDVLKWDIDFREKQTKIGKLCGVVISYKDADLLATLCPDEIRIRSCFKDEYSVSRNVIATIPGESPEVICFSAHYDSVPTSPGVYDNLTGVAGLFELFYYFILNKPKRTMKFLFAGSEELGLLGSLHFCKNHDLSNYRLNINIDMIGVTIGFDYAKITAESNFKVYLDYVSKIEGFNLKTSTGVYSSDSTSFADAGVPSVSFARLPIRGGKQIHNNLDNIDFLGKDNMEKSIIFILKLTLALDRSIVFPISQDIPPEIIKELNEYFSKDKNKDIK